jgi:hypothetical protein
MNKDKVIQIRVTKVQKEQLEELAKKNNSIKSELLLRKLIQQAVDNQYNFALYR